jgi:hypothetical protein
MCSSFDIPSAVPSGLRTTITLVVWEIWKERNARVFTNKYTMPLTIMQKIKDESKKAGAKHLAEIAG